MGGLTVTIVRDKDVESALKISFQTIVKMMRNGAFFKLIFHYKSIYMKQLYLQIIHKKGYISIYYV